MKLRQGEEGGPKITVVFSETSRRKELDGRADQDVNTVGAQLVTGVG